MVSTLLVRSIRDQYCVYLIGKDNPPAYTAIVIKWLSTHTTHLNFTVIQCWMFVTWLFMTSIFTICTLIYNSCYHCMYTLHVAIWRFIIVSRINSYSFLKWRYKGDLTHCLKFIGDEISKVDIMKWNTLKYKLSKFVTSIAHGRTAIQLGMYSSCGWSNLA